jgi:RimJ/RimL family protein N-acetyltransferase
VESRVDGTDAIETERLLLVPWSDEYVDDFAALCADAEAMRFISGGRPLPRENVEVILGRTRATRLDHLASRRVMEKCALTFQAEIPYRGTTVVWYAIDRPPDTDAEEDRPQAM